MKDELINIFMDEVLPTSTTSIEKDAIFNGLGKFMEWLEAGNIVTQVFKGTLKYKTTPDGTYSTSGTVLNVVTLLGCQPEWEQKTEGNENEFLLPHDGPEHPNPAHLVYQTDASLEELKDKYDVIAATHNAVTRMAKNTSTQLEQIRAMLAKLYKNEITIDKDGTIRKVTSTGFFEVIGSIDNTVRVPIVKTFKP